MKNLLISVVVPIYNVEPYLHRCIDSVINQTYSNLEIILVDDGSPDRCGEICDEYAKRDERIKVIHKENGGQSDARNAGMRIATGDYISFVDSDDYIAHNAYEVLLREAQTYQTDVLVGNAYCVSKNLRVEVHLKDINQYTVETGLDFMCRLKKERTDFPTPAWFHFIKLSSLIAFRIKFKKGYIQEDTLWTHQLFLNAKRVKYLNYPFYYYCLTEGSTTTRSFSKRGIFYLKIFCDLSIDYKNIENKKQRKILCNDISRRFLGVVRKVPLYEEPYRSFLSDKRFFPLKLSSDIYTYFGGILFAININLFVKTLNALSKTKQFLKSKTNHIMQIFN